MGSVVFSFFVFLFFLFFLGFLVSRLSRTWYMLHDLHSTKQDGWKTSRCESVYSSFEQLKEFKIDVNKGISESLKKTKHFALTILSLQHQIFG